MTNLLIPALSLCALVGGASAYANPIHMKHAAKAVEKKDDRAEKTRKSIAADLHRRGSNIPPAFSADGRWSR